MAAQKQAALSKYVRWIHRKTEAGPLLSHNQEKVP